MYTSDSEGSSEIFFQRALISVVLTGLSNERRNIVRVFLQFQSGVFSGLKELCPPNYPMIRRTNHQKIGHCNGWIGWLKSMSIELFDDAKNVSIGLFGEKKF
uniref:Uncharacterized protein n=1 Tax=Arundo donax TaxID=35708 RepID=A0A0A9FIJ1_ARUDO